MKLSKQAIISQEKITNYLLTEKKKNDKSKWLARAGYTLDNWKILENDLRNQILTSEARPKERTNYGQIFEIKGELLGPANIKLAVTTIWIIEHRTEITKFVTMYPNKKR